MSTVAERMSRDVFSVSADTTLVEAAQQMRISGVGAVPVTDRARECAGILTERDIVVRVLAEDREPRAALVRDVATMEPVTCAPGDDVAEAVELMREHQVQHLPVCEEDEVVGVLSLADIVFRRPDEERGTVVPPPVKSR